MRHLLVSALLVSVTSTGCYLGEKRSNKTMAEGISGAAVALGALALYANTNEARCSGINCDGGGGGVQAAEASLLSIGLIAAGSIGLLVNVITPTVPDVLPPPRPTGGTTVTVTAPGLRPAAVTLR